MTLAITGAALLVATVAGVLIAILFTQSRWVERAFFPYAVILQVTPVVAIAPLIIIWVKNIPLALLICAWIVAFFPIVSNTTLGLNSADHNLLNLFQLYGASRRQVFWYLRLPSAMPYFLGGLRISGGLALIGAVVAEFVAGTGGAQSGLAYRDPGVRLHDADSPDVRRAAHDHVHRHRHLPGAERAVPPRAAQVARERGRARGLR